MGVVAFGAAIVKFGEWPVFNSVVSVFGGVLFLVAAFGITYRGVTGKQPTAITASDD